MSIFFPVATAVSRAGLQLYCHAVTGTILAIYGSFIAGFGSFPAALTSTQRSSKCHKHPFPSSCHTSPFPYNKKRYYTGDLEAYLVSSSIREVAFERYGDRSIKGKITTTGFSGADILNFLSPVRLAGSSVFPGHKIDFNIYRIISCCSDLAKKPEGLRILHIASLKQSFQNCLVCLIRDF